MGVQAMRAAIRWLGILAILLAVSGPAWAGSVTLEGGELVIAKDLVQRSVLIGEQTFYVTPTTVIRLDGQVVRLEMVPVARPDDGTPVSEMRWGVYRAHRRGDRLELETLTLKPVPL